MELRILDLFMSLNAVHTSIKIKRASNLLSSLSCLNPRDSLHHTDAKLALLTASEMHPPLPACARCISVTHYPRPLQPHWSPGFPSTPNSFCQWNLCFGSSSALPILPLALPRAGFFPPFGPQPTPPPQRPSLTTISQMATCPSPHAVACSGFSFILTWSTL